MAGAPSSLPPAWITPGSTPNPDLARERSQASFNVAKMTALIDAGDAARASRRRELLEIVQSEAVFDNTHNNNLPRDARYRRAIAKARRYIELCARDDLSTTDQQTLYGLIADDSPMMLHTLMFIPNIVALADAEQCALWLPDAMAHRMIGCYAQTELGHGSNVRGVQTTATYDAATEEFVINTPVITASKWWPGSLGKTANTAMVIAQLIDGDGEPLGVHNFLVPIRDRATHMPLPGVALGDLGPKIGFNNMDNGWCVFDHVRVPRRNMAARYAFVDPAGKYVRVKQASAAAGKTAYITMMQVRAIIVANAGRGLAQAATIAIRYSVVRRQGFVAKESRVESQVLDYSTQAHRLLPLLATSYAWHFTGAVMVQRMRDLEAAIQAGDSRVGALLRAAHASFSGLKSLTSMIAADGMEECRRACGGAGFLKASGIPELLTAYLQNVTVCVTCLHAPSSHPSFLSACARLPRHSHSRMTLATFAYNSEGDNHMLPAQVVRILLKVLASTRSGKDTNAASGDVDYIATPLDPSARWSARAGDGASLRSAASLIEAYTHRALRLLEGVAALLRTSEMAGASAAEAWNGALIEMSRASRAHSFLVALRAFATQIETVAAAREHQREVPALRRLFALFALYWLEIDMGDFVEDGFLDSSQATAVRGEIRSLLAEIRPDAAALTDAWDFSDFVLQSAIGRYDGDVYPALMASAQRSVLNRASTGPGWAENQRALESGELAEAGLTPNSTMFTSEDALRAACQPASKL